MKLSIPKLMYDDLWQHESFTRTCSIKCFLSCECMMAQDVTMTNLIIHFKKHIFKSHFESLLGRCVANKDLSSPTIKMIRDFLKEIYEKVIQSSTD